MYEIERNVTNHPYLGHSASSVKSNYANKTMEYTERVVPTNNSIMIVSVSVSYYNSHNSNHYFVHRSP